MICHYYVTLRCNDTCEFCPIWNDENFKKTEEKPFDLSLLKRYQVSVLNITGGEPLLREDLPFGALPGQYRHPYNLLQIGNSVVFLQHNGCAGFAEHQHTCLNSTP